MIVESDISEGAIFLYFVSLISQFAELLGTLNLLCTTFLNIRLVRFFSCVRSLNHFWNNLIAKVDVGLFQVTYYLRSFVFR